MPRRGKDIEISIGIDIVSIERVRRIYLRYKERFLKRIFTREEQEICMKRRDPVPCFAGRFSAKEAFMKALGTGASVGVSFLHIEVLKEKSGRPVLNLTGNARKILGDRRAEVSITHGRDVAAAISLIYSNPELRKNFAVRVKRSGFDHPKIPNS